jgi:uncharacterized DUF497 family protein
MNSETEYEWDESKRLTNLSKHNVDFRMLYDADWRYALMEHDTRRDYGEERYRTLIPIGNRVYLLAHSFRSEKIRVISLRAANRNEVTYYVKQ